MRSVLVQNAHSDLLDSHTTITVLGHDYKVIKSIINEGKKIHKMMKASGPRETLIYIQSSGRSSTWDNDLVYGAVILSPTCLHTYLLVPLFTQVLVQEGRRGDKQILYAQAGQHQSLDQQEELTLYRSQALRYLLHHSIIFSHTHSHTL